MITKTKIAQRKDFLQHLPKNGVGVEIGVFKGEFSKDIVEVTKPKRFLLIDLWWKKFGEYYPDWGQYTDFGKLKTKDAFNEAKKNVSQSKNACLFQIGDSRNVLRQYENNYFDWAYLDSAHNYETTIEELNILKKKVKNSGVISGHDYHPSKDSPHYGVVEAINEFCSKTQWELKYHDNWLNWYLQISS